MLTTSMDHQEMKYVVMRGNSPIAKRPPYGLQFRKKRNSLLGSPKEKTEKLKNESFS